VGSAEGVYHGGVAIYMYLGSGNMSGKVRGRVGERGCGRDVVELLS